MWSARSHKHKHLQPSAYSRRTSNYVDRVFQLRYTQYILTMAIISTTLMLIPVFYFTNQNYNLFLDLSDLLNPSVSNYISREKVGLNVFLGMMFIASCLFWYILSRRMTAKIAGPAKILRNHIRMISRGDYSINAVRTRDDDEFKDLINAYNYLYALLKVQTERDLQSLEKINSAITNPITKELVNELILERKNKLGPAGKNLNPLISAAPAELHDSRHVS